MIRARLGVVVVAVVACKKAGVVAPTKAPPPVLEAERAIVLPPAAPGHVRLDALDVDIELPDGGRANHYLNMTEVTWGSCRAEIEPTWDAKQPRKVGTLVLDCRAKPECAAPCDTLAAIPGGTANDPYPSEPPAIELGTGGGMSGEISELAYVWTDGTVQLSGERCKRWRGRRGKLPPERVAALVDALERGGLLAYHADGDPDPCPDAGGTWLQVRAHGKNVDVMTRRVCAQQDPAVITDSIAAVRSVLGDNPCGPPAPR